jgi:hypothetical protein
MDRYDHLVHFTHNGVELRAITVDGFVPSLDRADDSEVNKFLSAVEVEESDTGKSVEVTPSIRAKILTALKEEKGITVFDSVEEASKHKLEE